MTDRYLTGKAPMPDLLSGIPRTVFETMLRDGDVRIRRFGAGEIVHLAGDPCDAADIVLEGRAGIERIGENGDLLVVADFGPGDVMGANLVFSAGPEYPMNIAARMPVVLLSFRREPLLESLSRHPEFLRRFLLAMSVNAGVLSGRIRDHQRRTIRDIVMTRLRDHRSATGERKLKLNLTKKELAEQIGVHRTSLSRELQKMKAAGLIDFDQRSITLREDP
ncbi:MAG: Crp/Fnr family transcriptional regulator [Clostridia bacterium]|nr:Crp/Fnr family transcriptional regulator [Clostridia bacterium]